MHYIFVDLGTILAVVVSFLDCRNTWERKVGQFCPCKCRDVFEPVLFTNRVVDGGGMFINLGSVGDGR